MYILNTDICISYHEFIFASPCVLLLFIFVPISVEPHFVYSILTPLLRQAPTAYCFIQEENEEERKREQMQLKLRYDK